MAATSARHPREGYDRRAERARLSFRKSARKALHREERLNLVEWTERKRRHGRFSKSPGSKVRIADLEVTRGPFLWFTEPGVREIGIQACTQSGKTFLMESVAGWVMHIAPGPILYVGPTIADAVQFTDEKFMQMVEATPVLKPKINTSRTSGNTNVRKRFPGGRMRAVGTEARGGFTMVADQYLLLDEIDGHGNAGGDGDTYLLAKGRTPEFAHSYKLLAVSSPTVEDRGKGLPSINKIYKSGDQRLPFVQCQNPECRHDHFMEWQPERTGEPSLHIPKRDDDARGDFMPDGAGYVCPKCRHVHTNTERLRMLRTGAIHWRATKKFKCCGVWQDPRERWEACDQTPGDYAAQWQPWGEPLGVPSIGYGDRGVDRARCQVCTKMPVPNRIATGHYGRYYRPQFSLAEMAHEFVEVIRDPSKRRAYWNTILGLPYADSKSQALSSDNLDARGEIWETRIIDDQTGEWEYVVPWGVAMMGVGIDVQLGSADGTGSRFALNRKGWGAGEEVYVLDYRETTANTRDVSEWERVILPYIEHAMQRADKRPFMPMYVCIDAGNNPDQASEFVARHRARLFARGIHLFAVKGLRETGAQSWRTWAGAAQSAKAFEKFNDANVRLWNVGTREAKDTISSYLRTEAGPGTVHYPRGIGRHWIDGVLAEDQVEKGGRLVWEHLRKSVKNEPLDTFVYNLAGLRAIQSMYPNWSLAWQAAQVGAITPAIRSVEGEDANAPGSAIADAAVRLHGALTALAAREGSAASQSSPTPTVPKPAPVEVELDEPWIAETGWHAPVMPWD
ncbi:phage terminase large subunit family protein [Sphingomonas sanguinis]|nr:phage terminase large subunit family protein [Sphingomonas sp. LC-1]